MCIEHDMADKSHGSNLIHDSFKKKNVGWGWWLTPVSQHFGRLRWVDHLRSGIQDQPGQHGEILFLLKIKKLAGHGGTLL